MLEGGRSQGGDISAHWLKNDWKSDGVWILAPPSRIIEGRKVVYVIEISTLE